MIDARLGDCREILGKIEDESVDIVLTDPPYGINYATSRRSQPHRFDHEIANDKDLSMLEAVIPDLYRVLRPDTACFVFCSWKRLGEACQIIRGGGFNVKNNIIWDKGNTTAGDLAGAYGYQYEVIIFAAKGSPKIRGKRHSDIWRFPRVSPEKLIHQNEKPVPLLERMIASFSDEAAMVVDPFMGSGSTGVACLNMGRSFIGCEIDEGYYEIAKRRLETEQAQGRLFFG